MKKIIILILIALLSFFSYQAINRGLSFIQLNNTQYYLLNNIKKGIKKEESIKKIKIALDYAKKQDPNNPQYYALLADSNVWQNFYDKNSSSSLLKQAKINYQEGLKIYPNNPHFWKGLAKINHDYLTLDFSLIAMDQAVYYAHSNGVIMREAMLWKISHWQALNQEQKQIAIAQIKQFVHIKEARRSIHEVKQLLKKTGYRNSICSRLPRTQEFKGLCY